MTWDSVLVLILLALGTLLMGVASIGILRMPDALMRMQAATKASALGAGLLLAGVAIHFHGVGVTSRAVATILFLFMTVPVAAHLLGRAAYLTGSPLVEDTRLEVVEDKDAKTRQP